MVIQERQQSGSGFRRDQLTTLGRDLARASSWDLEDDRGELMSSEAN